VARVVFTTAADADADVIFEGFYAKAGKPTVVKYRALFRRLYQNLDLGRRAPKSAGKFASASSLRTS
jgi:hypothetical protein